MTDEDATEQIDEMFKQHTLSLLYRLEKLEARSGLHDATRTLQRLPSLETQSEQEIATEMIIARIEILEGLYGE